jgi:hypothetical protein
MYKNYFTTEARRTLLTIKKGASGFDLQVSSKPGFHVLPKFGFAETRNLKLKTPLIFPDFVRDSMSP